MDVSYLRYCCGGSSCGCITSRFVECVFYTILIIAYLTRSILKLSTIFINTIPLWLLNILLILLLLLLLLLEVFIVIQYILFICWYILIWQIIIWVASIRHFLRDILKLNRYQFFKSFIHTSISLLIKFMLQNISFDFTFYILII